MNKYEHPIIIKIDSKEGYNTSPASYGDEYICLTRLKAYIQALKKPLIFLADNTDNNTHNKALDSLLELIKKDMKEAGYE